jgi:hypothetical protein
VFDPAPEEPDEPNPEDRWGDPERELPQTPRAPTVQDPTTNEVSNEVAFAFWSVVLLVNVGLFVVSLGPMLAFFEGRWKLGGGLTAVGVFAFVHAYRRYRRFQREQDGEGGDPEPDGEADPVTGGRPDGEDETGSVTGAPVGSDGPETERKG